MARFNVYNASAGSGKTYSLVQNYLRICLATENPKSFMRILAITFTNKAANEMKDRIVAKLKEIRDFNTDGVVPSMMDELCASLEISREKLSYRAERTLKAILHQYSAFAVSTIDKFTNRLIRSFARDLKLHNNYEVELDNDGILQEAIDEMMSGLKEDSITTQFLLRFVNENLEEGKSPRPEIQLKNMGRNLFKEEAFNHIKRLREIPKEELLPMIGVMQEERARIEASVAEMAKENLEFVNECGLDANCFNRGYVYTWLTNVSDGQTEKWIPNPTALSSIKGETEFYTKGKAKELASTFERINPELRPRLNNLLDYIHENATRHHILSRILSNIYTLAVLTEIDHHLQEVKDNSNRLPIGEFNKLISEKLENESADYIYEKLGERYRNFFIDEFQDTSNLQWKNLIPLINNSLASGGSVMIVGDAKQSIYRWRGGEVSQFIGLANDTDPGNKVFSGSNVVELYERETFQLPTNYRSRKNIVDFNNEFFTRAAELLLGEDYKEIYRQSGQEVHHGEGGYIELQLVPHDSSAKEAYQLEQCQRCLDIIEDARSRNYPLSEITILVRNKKEGAIIAEFLLGQNIKVISPDSLNISGSAEVMALISYLYILSRPDDVQNRYDFLQYLHKLKEVNAQYDDRHVMMVELLELPATAFHQRLSEILPEYDISGMYHLSLPDKVFHLVSLLNLDIQHNPFLHAFLDQVEGFHQKEGEDIAGFIRWWESTGHKQNIGLPEGSDALKLMTIHKSKGLQFGICILAFADWLATKENGASRAWIDLQDEDYVPLPSAWVTLGNPKGITPVEGYAQALEKNSELVYFDNINLMYVALTRAVDELYILGGDEGLHQEDSRVYRYLKDFMEHKSATNNWTLGSKVPANTEESIVIEDHLKTYHRTQWKSRLKVAASAPLYWQGQELSEEISYGKKVHGLLARIDVESDIDELLDHEVRTGNLLKEEAANIRSSLHKITRHPELSRLYSSDVQVLNEAEILNPDGSTSRPDRTVIEGNKAHVIDYKTGKESNEHFKQIESYRLLLNDMGYENGESLLVYIGKDIHVKNGTVSKPSFRNEG